MDFIRNQLRSSHVHVHVSGYLVEPSFFRMYIYNEFDLVMCAYGAVKRFSNRVHTCVCACVRVYVCACMCVCVCVC